MHLQIFFYFVFLHQVCFMRLEGERSLRSHQKFHVTNFQFECSQCLIGFTDEKKMRKHRKIHLNYFECTNCSEEFETYVRFIKHLEDSDHHKKYKNSYEKHLAIVPKVKVSSVDNIESQVIEDTNLMSDCDLAFNFGPIDIEDELCKSPERSNEENAKSAARDIFQDLRFSDSDNDFNIGSFNFDCNYSDSNQSMSSSEQRSEMKASAEVTHYKCEGCGFKCSDPVDFYDVEKHGCGETRVFLCVECEEPLTTGPSLLHHRETRHWAGTEVRIVCLTRCGVCQPCISSPQTACLLGRYYQLSRERQQGSQVSCTICQALIRSEDIFHHLHLHTCLYPRACKRCYKEFACSPQHRSHLEDCESYRCFLCGQLEENSEELDRHLVSKHSPTSLVRMDETIKSQIRDLFPVERKPTHREYFSEDSSQSDSQLQAGSSVASNGYLQTLICKRKGFIEKLTELVQSNRETGVTFDFIETHFSSALESEHFQHFQHSIHSYVEAALLQGRIRKELKGEEEYFYPASASSSSTSVSRTKQKLRKRCGECSACLKEDCGNCKSCIIKLQSPVKSSSEKAPEKKCLRRRCQNLKRLNNPEDRRKKKYSDQPEVRPNLNESINSILTEVSSILNTNTEKEPEPSISDIQEEKIEAELTSNPQSGDLVGETVSSADFVPSSNNIVPSPEDIVPSSNISNIQIEKEIRPSVQTDNTKNINEDSALVTVEKESNESESTADITNIKESEPEPIEENKAKERSEERSTNKKRIPIYRSALTKIRNEEYFSDKFVNKNKLQAAKKNTLVKATSSQSKQRKFIERRKFGSLKTKFKGKKSFATGTKFEENDPFSLEVDEHEEEKPAVLENPPMPTNTGGEATMTVDLTKGSKRRGRPGKRLDAPNSLIAKKAKKRPAEETNKVEKSSSDLVESNQDPEVKPKRQKRKKTAAAVRAGSPSPSCCPHCFKFLLNPEKMRSHVASCQRTSDHHIKLTIRLSSDKEKVEIKESN